MSQEWMPRSEVLQSFLQRGNIKSELEWPASSDADRERLRQDSKIVTFRAKTVVFSTMK